MGFLTYPELLKDLHIAIASIRNGFAELHNHLGQWLHISVEFVHEPAGSEVDLFLFWTLLGVEPDIAQQLAERRIFFGLRNLRFGIAIVAMLPF